MDKIFKIKSICDSYGGTMVSVAPGNIITIFYVTNSWVITVNLFRNFLIFACKFNGLRLYVPADTVFTEPCIDIHGHSLAVTAEYSCKPLLKRHYRTVKNTIRGGYCISSDNWVCIITPDRIVVPFRFILPRKIII